ncbi:MAG: lysine--tRNA ligase [Verrucomicrobiales bacterium]
MEDDATQTPPPAAESEQESEHKLIRVRREKLAKLRELGVDPYGARFEPSDDPGTLRANFEEGRKVVIAGRLVAHRDMGKSQFFDIADITGRLQCFLNAKGVGEEAFEIFKLLDLGDFVGIRGETFITRTGEPTVKASALTVLSKSLRPLPEKWHGLADREARYRQRYLDLIANEKSRETFVMRSRAVAEIRSFLHARGFLEVETPMLQDVPGGAAATPFETHHKALNIPLYLRIAPELFLKRLLIGGFTKVFELNRSFRNEGISRRHNPEFTMLEAYWAYHDFEGMADLVEELICHLAPTCCGGLVLEQKNEEGEIVKIIDLTRPWARRDYKDLIREIDARWFDYSRDERLARCGELGVETRPQMEDYELTQHLFEKLVEEKAINPLFVTHVPSELVPLAKTRPGDESVVDVFELLINGQEISPGYSEQNDPQAQRRALEAQKGGETQAVDEEFILALEHGMPTAGGIGIGIDRLLMMLSGVDNIRDVVLFPQLKPKSE